MSTKLLRSEISERKSTYCEINSQLNIYYYFTKAFTSVDCIKLFQIVESELKSLLIQILLR